MTPVNIDYDLICQEISNSDKSIAIICKEQGYNYNTVLQRCLRDDAFHVMLTRARKAQADHIVSTILDELKSFEIDLRDPSIDKDTKHALNQFMRTKIDSIKWIACKYRPELYGDRIQLDNTISVNIDKFRQLFSPSKIDNINNSPEVIECKEVKEVN